MYFLGRVFAQTLHITFPMKRTDRTGTCMALGAQRRVWPAAAFADARQRRPRRCVCGHWSERGTPSTYSCYSRSPVRGAPSRAGPSHVSVRCRPLRQPASRSRPIVSVHGARAAGQSRVAGSFFPPEVHAVRVPGERVLQPARSRSERPCRSPSSRKRREAGLARHRLPTSRSHPEVA